MSQAIFRDTARDWWTRYMLRGSRYYAEECWRRLEKEVMPEIGSEPLANITAPMILTILRRIEARGAVETAHKVKAHISQTFRYGIACGLAYTNPARDLSYAITPRRSTPRAAITDPRQVGLLMRDLSTFPSVKRRCAVQLTGPNGRTVDVMTAWIYERKSKGKISTTPRLINCFITNKSKAGP